MATWTDIKELAAQLKETQEKSSAHVLSERTWVDIVRHLTNTQRLKLIYTSDGRSFLTKEELDKEIREEVDAHGGRVSFVEMASILDVDPFLLETRVLELVASDAQSAGTNRLMSIPGEVVSEMYVRHVAQELQDKFEERGQVSIGELATSFCLPTAFLINVINKYQGTLFKVQKMGDQYVTDAFMNENRARVRGYFTAVMRPTTLNSVASKWQMPESLLSSIISSFIGNGQLSGSLAAARGTYIPTCYVKAEDSYISSFYSQNGYIEWSHLKRMGIADPASYTRSRFPNAIHVTGISVGPMIIDQLKATIDEAVRESNWADLNHILPISLSSAERVALVSPYLHQKPLSITEDGTYLITEAFVTQCEPLFESFVRAKAELAAKDGRKSAGSTHTSTSADQELGAKRVNHSIKGGFGMGAREIKNKNVKKKYNPSKRRNETNAQNNWGDETNTGTVGSKDSEAYWTQYISVDDLEGILSSELPDDTPEEVLSGTVSLLLPNIGRSFTKMVESIFLPNSDTANRRERLVKTQNTINDMVIAMQLLERGINGITDTALRDQLLNHLVRQHGTVLLDQLCMYIAQTHDLCWPSSSEAPIGPEQRRQLVSLLNGLNHTEASQLAVALDRVLESCKSSARLKNCTDFHALLDTVAEPLGLNVGRADSKRKRDERAKAVELAVQVEQQLEQAIAEGHVASVALSAACLLAQAVTGWPVSAPGKCVPQLVSWLCDKSDVVSAEAVEDLKKLTTAVSERMRAKQEGESVDDLIPVCERLMQHAKKCRRALSST